MQQCQRWIFETIKEALQYRRVIILSGARQCGKTTLALDLSGEGTLYRTLDSVQSLDSAISDPEGFVEHGDELMVIDEIQRSPLLLQVIKKNVDENKKYGRFLLTGSANIFSLPNVTESLAGRVSNIRLRPLVIAEIQGKAPNFLHNAFNAIFNMDTSEKYLVKDDYLRTALQGGYPEAISLPLKKAIKWHKDYIKSLIDRDLKDIINIRRKNDMHKLLRVLCAWSTKEINIQAIGSSLSIERATIETYINALETLYLIDRIPAWGKNDYDGVRKKDKLMLSDTGLMASVLNWNFSDIQLDGERNGKIIENFVYQQLASLIDVSEEESEIYHYRDSSKREIDFIIENVQGDILGIEVKAGSAVKATHFKHLKWFQQNMATDRNFVGIVFYTGKEILPFGKNMWAVPISSLWA